MPLYVVKFETPAKTQFWLARGKRASHEHATRYPHPSAAQRAAHAFMRRQYGRPAWTWVIQAEKENET